MNGHSTVITTGMCRNGTYIDRKLLVIYEVFCPTSTLRIRFIKNGSGFSD